MKLKKLIKCIDTRNVDGINVNGKFFKFNKDEKNLGFNKKDLNKKVDKIACKWINLKGSKKKEDN